MSLQRVEERLALRVATLAFALAVARLVVGINVVIVLGRTAFARARRAALVPPVALAVRAVRRATRAVGDRWRRQQRRERRLAARRRARIDKQIAVDLLGCALQTVHAAPLLDRADHNGARQIVDTDRRLHCLELH